MNKFYRRIENKIRVFRESVTRKGEEALLKASAIHLHFAAKPFAQNGATTNYPYYGRAMPDVNKHIDFSKMTHISPEEVKAWGILNAGAKLSDTSGTGKIGLVYRQPGGTQLIPVPEVKIHIQNPAGLSVNKDFAQEGTAYFDLSFVPAGATLFVQVQSDGNYRVTARTVDLRIEFRLNTETI